MRTFVYSVYDKKAGSYGQPFTSNHEAHALRSVQQAANDLQSSLGQYPSDFTLYKIGYFDDASGELVPDKSLTFITEVISLVRTDNQLELMEQSK